MGKAKFGILDVELSQIVQLYKGVAEDFHGWKPVAVASIKYSYHPWRYLLLKQLELPLPGNGSESKVPADVDNLPIRIMGMNIVEVLVV